MKEYSELKKYAEIALATHESSSLAKSLRVTSFYGRATPTAVLELISEVESMKKDAARYRWLRKQNWFDSDIAVVRSPNESIKIGYDCPSTERLDDYIDNEMKESKI